MGTCMAIGEAAGTAAALAVRRQTDPASLPVSEIKHALRTAGALVEP